MSELPDNLLRSLRSRLSSRSRRTESGCLEYTGHCRPAGYGQIGVGRTPMDVHRASWILEHGEIPENMLILHKCDNPPCFNIEHLYAGTHQDNVRDRVSRGRSSGAKGLANANGKLTDNQIIAIRARYKPGVRPWLQTGRSSSELATEFGVTRQYINQLGRGMYREQV